MTEFGYGKFTPMKLKSEATYAVRELIQDVGIPKEIHTDGAKELTSGSWRQVCRDAGIKTTQTEKNSPWQNRTEVEIRELKQHVRRLMTRSSTPLCLWDYCCKYVVELRNRTARPLPQLNGRTPGWYQLVWYYEPQVFPNQTRLPARWSGVAHRVGQAMCYWLLPESGVPIARTTIQSISNEELATAEVKRIIDVFNHKLISKPGEIQGNTINDSPTFKLYKEDGDPQDLDFEQELFDPNAAQVDVDDIDNEVFDELLLTEPVLHRDGQLIRAKVMGRKRDKNGRVIGKYNPNPLLNSAVYLAEFPDGHIQELGAKARIEAIYNQIDEVGNNEVLFRDIIGHRCDSTLRENSEGRVNNRTVTTQGWEICVS
jgi:hypothetical protein